MSVKKIRFENGLLSDSPRMQSGNELLSRRQALESVLQDCALAGVEPPENTIEELQVVCQQISALKEVQVPVTSYPWTRWLGQKLEGFILKHLLLEDSFSLTFVGESDGAEQSKLFTIARPECITNAPGDFTAVYKVCPFDTRQVKVDCNATVAFLGKSDTANGFAYRTRPFSGTSLKESAANLALEDRLSLLPLFAQIAESLINENKQGNLKPNNIFISDSVNFIQPGYLGAIESLEGPLDEVTIAAVNYYPNLDGDDILALGICLFETMTGKAPFDTALQIKSITENLPPNILAESLVEEINFKRSLLQPYSTPLFRLQRPTEYLEYLGSELETLLFKALRLKLNGQKLERDNGFADFAEMAAALREAAQIKIQ